MTFEPWVVAIALAAIVVGSTLQRLSGTGVGLVVAPTLAVLIGPTLGVFLTNACTVVSASVISVAVRKRIQWKRAGAVLLAALPGAALGAWLVLVLPAAWLSIVIGAIVIVALAVTFTAKRPPHVDHPAALATAGAIGGLFNTSAGIAAPALVIYSRMSRWPHPEFAATLQPIFLGMGAMSVGLKLAFGASGFVGLPPWWIGVGVVGAVLVGLGIGTWLDGRVPAARAQQLAIVLAALGGIVAIARGVTTLLA